MTKNHNSQEDKLPSEATISLIKNVCTRISQALEEIQEICVHEGQDKPGPSQFGKAQGIGLFLYVKDKQDDLKNKFPAFNDNQILSILIAQWQKLPEDQKFTYCSKIKLNPSSGNKRLKKLDKKVQKLCQMVPQQKQKKYLQNSFLNVKNKKQLKVDKVVQIQIQEEHQDNFFNEPACAKKKAQNSIISQQQVQEKKDNQIKNQHKIIVRTETLANLGDERQIKHIKTIQQRHVETQLKTYPNPVQNVNLQNVVQKLVEPKPLQQINQVPKNQTNQNKLTPTSQVYNQVSLIVQNPSLVEQAVEITPEQNIVLQQSNQKDVAKLAQSKFYDEPMSADNEPESFSDPAQSNSRQENQETPYFKTIQENCEGQLAHDNQHKEHS